MSQDWAVRGRMMPGGEPVEWLITGSTGRLGTAEARDVEVLPGRYVLAGLVDAHTHLTFDQAGWPSARFCRAGRAQPGRASAGRSAARA